MSFLKRMIKDGIREGVSNAIGDAVKGAVEPAATNLANKAAAKIEDVAEKDNAEAAEKQAETKSAFSGLEGAFANLEKAAQSYATEISKNMKVCPECNTPTDAAKKFCPECGAKLPEETVADSSVCKECGTQNTPGTKFCQDVVQSCLRRKKKKPTHRQRTMMLWQHGMNICQCIQNGPSAAKIWCWRITADISTLV